MSPEQNRLLLKRCLDLAVASVDDGGGPFAALVARGGEVLAEAANRVNLINDPTAHAEVEAIRRAASAAGDPFLTGCVLYVSCEPCPMCLAASMWARLAGVVHAAGQQEADRAGFLDREIAYSMYGQARPVRLRDDYLQQHAMPEAAAPFEAWLAKQDRAEY